MSYMSIMMHVISTIIILAWVSTINRVAGQSSECGDSLNLATLSAASNPACECSNDPVCTACIEDGLSGTTACTDNCEYCSSELGVCGTFVATSSVAYGVGASIVYVWTYTKGRTGTLSFLFESAFNTCTVEINGQACTTCVIYECDGDSYYEPGIDCTNIEAGATALSPCTRPLYGGWASVDESARGGILAPFVIPYYGCQVASSGSPVATSATLSPVATVPSASPPTTSDTPSPTAAAGTPPPSGTGSSPTASPTTTSDTPSATAPANTPPSGTGPSPTASPPTNSGTISPTDPDATFPPFIRGSSANNLMPFVKTFLIPLVGTATYHILFSM